MTGNEGGITKFCPDTGEPKKEYADVTKVWDKFPHGNRNVDVLRDDTDTSDPHGEDLPPTRYPEDIEGKTTGPTGPVGREEEIHSMEEEP